MWIIKIPNKFTGVRYGITFSQGEGKTDDTRIIEIMRKKNFEVCEELEQSVETVPDYHPMTDDELVAVAAARGVDISKAKTRTAIIKLLTK